MPEQWPDTKRLDDLDFLNLRDRRVLAAAGATTVGEARRVSDRELSLEHRLGRRSIATLRLVLEGPRCGEWHPPGTGRNSVGWCVRPRGHEGEHRDANNHFWGDPDAIPDDCTLDELDEFPLRLQSALSKAGITTAGQVRGAPDDIAGIGKKGWAELRAMGLRPDSCGAVSPHTPPGRPLAERRCVLPRGHYPGHEDLQGETWGLFHRDVEPVEDDDPDGALLLSMRNARWSVAQRTHGLERGSLVRLVVDWWISAAPDLRWTLEPGPNVGPRATHRCDALLGDGAKTVGILEVDGSRQPHMLGKLGLRLRTDDEDHRDLQLGLFVGYDRKVGPTPFEEWERIGSDITADLRGKALVIVAVEKAWRSTASACNGFDGTVWSGIQAVVLREGAATARAKWAL